MPDSSRSLATIVFETVSFRSNLPDTLKSNDVPIADRFHSINKALDRIALAKAEGGCVKAITADAAIIVSNLSDLIH